MAVTPPGVPGSHFARSWLKGWQVSGQCFFVRPLPHRCAVQWFIAGEDSSRRDFHIRATFASGRGIQIRKAERGEVRKQIGGRDAERVTRAAQAYIA